VKPGEGDKRMNRCGKCDNCLKIDKIKVSILRCCNPPFTHADQDIIDVWNDQLKEFPCLAFPIK